MSARNTEDGEIQRVVRAVGYPTQEVFLMKTSRTWSVADFEYALERLEVDQPMERRAGVRELYRNLRNARQA